MSASWTHDVAGLSFGGRPVKKTRYNCRSNPPPVLKVVLRLMMAEIPANGFAHRNEIFGLARRANKRGYDKRGAADDLVRFLENVQLMREDPVSGRWVLNKARVAAVLAACDTGAEPSDAEIPATVTAEQKPAKSKRRTVHLVPARSLPSTAAETSVQLVVDPSFPTEEVRERVPEYRMIRVLTPEDVENATVEELASYADESSLHKMVLDDNEALIAKERHRRAAAARREELAPQCEELDASLAQLM